MNREAGALTLEQRLARIGWTSLMKSTGRVAAGGSSAAATRNTSATCANNNHRTDETKLMGRSHRMPLLTAIGNGCI